MKKLVFIVCLFCMACQSSSQPKREFAVIAYYAGKDLSEMDKFSAEKLTHIIYSFCHLKGNRLNVYNAKDSAVIQKLVSLKKRNPQLKVLLSLGGWGGCETCSDAFSTEEGRKEFAASVKALGAYFKTDGIDLDWEYPTIEGYPGHKFQPADKTNFTGLVKELRKTLGKNAVVSFAAGGFNKFIEESVDWKEIMPHLDYVNVMTYDLTNGYSNVTGHHTPLYSSLQQIESTDNAVEKLLALNVSAYKIIIGAAFYGRIWENVPDSNSGLYQPGKFLKGVAYKNFASELSAQNGFTYYWDNRAMSPYLYNAEKKWFVTYDDKRSMQLKTKYAIGKGLGGIMFWELTNDFYSGGLLDAIDTAKRSAVSK